MRALAYLGFRQLVNSIRNLARSPKQLAIGIILALWFLSVPLANLLYRRQQGFPDAAESILGRVTGLGAEAVHTFVFALLSLGVVAVIYSAFSQGLLVFSLAEVDFVFPTPINRRTVLAMKVLRDHLKAALLVLLVLLLVGPSLSRLTAEPLFPSMAYVWLALFLLWTSTVHTAHIVNILATFQLARLRYAHTALRGMLLGLILLLVAAVKLFARAQDAGHLLRIEFLSSVLFPIRWATDIVLTPAWGVTDETPTQVLGLLALSAATFWLLLSLQYNIYEPTLGVSVRTAQKRAAFRSGGLAALRVEVLRSRTGPQRRNLGLPIFGMGASALLWKNLTARLRGAALSTATVVVLPPVFVWIVSHYTRRLPHDVYVGYVLLGEAAYVTWMLALFAIHELKSELRQSDILKAMPFRPAEMMFYIGLAAAAPSVLFALSSVLSIWGFCPQVGAYLALSALVGLSALTSACVFAEEIAVMMYPNMRDIVHGFLGFWLSLLLAFVAFVPSAITVAIGFVLRLNPLVVAVGLLIVNGAASVLFCSVAGLMFQKFDPTGD